MSNRDKWASTMGGGQPWQVVGDRLRAASAAMVMATASRAAVIKSPWVMKV